MTEGDERPRGFHMVKLYPVEGDTAIAELSYDDDVWADVRLSGINLDARGDERIREVTAVVRLYPHPSEDRQWWEFDLSDVSAQLEQAREWLLANERGREPLADEGGLTAAGSAFTKISLEDELWHGAGGSDEERSPKER